MSLSTIELKEVCDFAQGGRHKLSGKHFVEDGYPAYGAGGMNGLLPIAEFDRDAIVLSSIGARCGKCFLAEGKWSSLANTQVILPDESRADIRFLWYQLNDEGRWPRRGVAQPFIRPSDVKTHRVYFPSLEEQRRIAGILDAADALRRRRREAVALLDTLPGAVFAEMFGDPVGKSQKRNFVPLGSITSKIGSGATPRGGAKVYREEGTKFIRSMNVRDGTFSEEGMVCIDEKAAQQLSNVEVTKDDVFLNITGASVARCCRSDATLTGARVNQHVAIIRPQNPVFTDFIMGALCHPHMRANLLRIAESGATRQAITKSEIEGLEVPAPTENEAEEYSRRLRVLNGARDLVSDQQSELETLFASLQSRAFAGEL